MIEEEIGQITHYFGKINVAIIKLNKGSLKVGDTIHIKGQATDLTQIIDSLEIEHQKVSEAKEGENFGVKVSQKVRQGDKVFKVIEET